MEGRAGDDPKAVQPLGPAGLRVSDDDRHKVAEILRQAAGEGRIDLSELDERLEAAYSAKTYGELVPITADLPAHVNTHPVIPGPPAPHVPASSYSNSIAVMSETKRVGVWNVGAQQSAFVMMGGVTLDLRQAQFRSREVEIWACAIMGEIKVIVNPGTALVVEGVGIMGEFKEQRPKAVAELTHDSPVVRVKGFALMGSVNVQRKAMPGESDLRKWLRRSS